MGGRGDKKIDFGIWFLEQSIFYVMGIVYPQYWLQIDVEFISLTFGNVESLLPNPTCMSTIQRWQVSVDGSCNFIKVGVGCSTRFIQVDNEI